MVFAQDNTTWHDVTEWGVEGRGWGGQERLRWFDRFPAKAEKTVTKPVWNLSRHSAGMMVRFKTDANAIHARWKLLNSRLGMPHMPPSGVSGLDLYARDDKGKWRWAAATRPDKQEMQAALLTGIAPGMREYAVYLPLYNGTESLAIGVALGAKFERLAPRLGKAASFLWHVNYARRVRLKAGHSSSGNPRSATRSAGCQYWLFRQRKNAQGGGRSDGGCGCGLLHHRLSA